jgi:Protein of unknown function (DUF1566)
MKTMLRSSIALFALAGAAGVVAASPADAPAGRYTVQSGTVYDTVTRLTWQQTPDVNSYTWAQAGTYCAGLGSGWRVPTVGELQTIVDEARASGAAIDRTAFPNTPATWFWTSTSVVGLPNYAWYVDFTIGAATFRPDNKPTTNRVRCVR